MQITYDLTEEDYMDLLDDIYGTVEIAGMTYNTGRALRELDPIAFRCGLSDIECGRLADLEEYARYEISAEYYSSTGGLLSADDLEVSYTGNEQVDGDAVLEAVLELAPEGTTRVDYRVVLLDSNDDEHDSDTFEHLVD